MKGRACTFALLTLAMCAGAGAHAFLQRATPAVGSAVRESPAQVKLWFSEDLEPAFSTLKVMGPDGKEVDKRDKRVDSANATLMEVSLPTLPPGRYRVVWRALSVDTHVTEGDFVFDIAP